MYNSQLPVLHIAMLLTLQCVGFQLAGAIYQIDMNSRMDSVLDNVEMDCPGCKKHRQEQLLTRTMNETQMRELRIEMIKNRILRKLNMTGPPPNLSRRKHIPEPLLRRFEISNEWQATEPEYEESEEASTEQMAIFPEHILNCGRRNNPAGCLHFRLADKLKNVEVVSAELWVYHRTDDRINQTFTISEVKQGRSRKVLDTKYTDTNDEWVKFDFSDIIQRWSKRRHSNHVIKVTCKTCRMREIPFESNNELRPFLMIQVGHHISRHRQKRHISCSPRVKDCCKQNFYVTFKELGWDDWIVRPAGYNANYCKGSCEGDILTSSHHTSVMQRIAYEEENRNLRAKMTPCCAPFKLSPLSVILLDEDGTIISKIMQNMKVESCTCM